MKNTQHKKTIVLLSLLAALGLPVMSQDIHFSQLNMAPLHINPAQAGAQYELRGILNYKSQWASVATPYKTMNLGFDMRLGKNKTAKGFHSLGTTIFNDKAGDSKMGIFQGNIHYAYHIMLDKNSTLGAGIAAGFAQRSIDFGALQWGNQYDGMNYNATLSSQEPTGSNSISYMDLGGGIHYEYGKDQRYITGNDQRNFGVGVAAWHVNQPKYTFYGGDNRLDMKMVGYANAVLGINNTQISLEPGVFYFQQGTLRELLVGSNFRYQLREESKYTGYVKGSAVSLGVFYRNKDAVISSFLFEFSHYAIGISYDSNISNLKTASQGRGGIEISLRFLNPNPFMSKGASRI